MKNEKVFKEVLTKAFARTMEDFSYNVDLQNGDDKTSVSFEDYFEDTLANVQLMSEKAEEKSTDCAVAFALHSINVAAQTRQIQNSIDDFFTSADNQQWLKENGIADNEKNALCQELKNLISDKMAIKGSTKEEKEFVEKINAVFDSKEGKPADHLENALGFISDVNKYRQNGYNAKDALNSAYNDLALLDGGNKITDAIFNNISALAGSIDKESADKYMKNVCENYIEDKEVSTKSFSEHYNNLGSNALTPNEKEWAHKTYCRLLFNTMDSENGYDLNNIEITSFLANGEQIISNEEFENANNKNGVFIPEKSVDIKPDDILLKDNNAMSFRIFNEHYKYNPNRLTSYDKQWANEAFDKMYHSVVNVKTDWNVQDVNMSSFYANGKQIITNEEYENAKNEKGELATEKESEMKLKIAAKLAAGDKITVRRIVLGKPLSLEVPKSKENSKP